MPAIPEFQRRRLASSVVGTPGVSTAGAALGEAVAGFGSGLAKGAFGELAAIQQAQDTQARRIKEVSSGNRAIRQSLAFRNQGQALQKSILKTGGTQKDLDSGLNDLRDNFLSEDEDPVFQRNFSKEANGHIKGISGSFFRGNQKKQLRGIVDDMNGTADEAAKMVSDEFADPDSDIFSRAFIMDMATKKTDEMIAKNQGQLSSEELAKFRKEKDNALVQAAVNSLIEHFPGEVDDFLDSEEAGLLALDQDISDEDKTAIRKEAADFMAKKRKVAEEAARRSEAEAEGEMLDRMVDGDTPSLTEIAQSELREGKGGISKGFATALRKLKKSTKSKKLGNNPKSYLELNTQLRNLAKAKKTQKVSEATVDAFILERVSLLRQNLLEAQAAGTVSKKEADAINKIIGPGFTALTTELVRRLNVYDKGSEMADDLPKLFFTEAGDIEKATMDFQTDLLERINDAEDKGESLSVSGVREIVNDLKNEFLFQNNPNRGKFKIGDIVERAGVTYEVAAYSVIGEPLLREVTSSTKQKEPEE